MISLNPSMIPNEENSEVLMKFYQVVLYIVATIHS